jgi:hypothetical protein
VWNQLRLLGERAKPVPPLSRNKKVSLFTSRSFLLPRTSLFVVKLLWVVDPSRIDHNGRSHLTDEVFWGESFKLFPLCYDNTAVRSCHRS